MRHSIHGLGSLFALFALTLAVGCGEGDTSGDAGVPDGSVSTPAATSSSDGYGDYAQSGYDEESSSDPSDDGYGDYPPANNPDAAVDGYGNPVASGNDEGYTEIQYGAPDEGIGRPDDATAAYQNTGSSDDAYANSGNGYGNTNNSSDDGYGAYGNPSAAAGGASDGYGEAAGGNVDFAGQIEPILRNHCYNCHGGGPRGNKGDLELHTLDAIVSSGVVVNGRPDSSELFLRVTMDRNEEGTMPPKGPGLRPNEIALLRTWIQSGASSEADPYGGEYGNSDDSYGADDDQDAERRRPPPPKNLAGFADRAFSRGNDPEAMNYLFAQTLVDSDDGKAILKKYRWVPGVKRPKLAVRWGIGVTYSQEGSWNGSPKPIGEDQNIPGLDDEDNDRSDEDSDRPEFEPTYMSDALDYYTGEFGATLVRRIEMRIEEGFYGPLLEEQLASFGTQPSDEDGFGDEADSDGGYGGYSDAGISRPRRGGNGYGGSGTSGGGDGDDDDEPEDKVEQIMPGITMLGHTSKVKLFQRAQEQGLDLLAIFDVRVERNHKARLYSNKTKVRLYDVATKKQVAVSKSLVNVEVQRARTRDPEDDSVNLALDKLFLDVADKLYRCVDFPASAKEGHAIRFVKELIEMEPQSNPLWMLGEVRFYESLGLLQPVHVKSAFAKLAPEKGASLVNVSGDDTVKTLLASWLVTEEPDRGEEDDDDEDEDEDEDTPARNRPSFR